MSTNGGADCQVPSVGIKPWFCSHILGFFALIPKTQCIGQKKLGLLHLVHFKLCIITPMATKVHVILWIFVVLTWMGDTIELV